MSTSDCTVRDEREPTPEMLMDVLLAVLYVHQSLQHLFHGGGNACVGGVSVLQVEQVGHFLVDIDAGNVIETRLQRVEHDRLAVLEPRRRIRSLARLAQQLAQATRQRTSERRGQTVDA